MSNWNEAPDWNLLSTINSGKEFSAADGLLASDVVRIVENVVYVYNQQNGLQEAISTVDSRLYAVQANIGSLSELTTENKSSIVASINEVNENQTITRNSLADLKEALYGYVLDTTEIETESTIPYTVEVGGTTYNLVDGVRGLVEEIKGGTVKSKNLFDINLLKGITSFDVYGNSLKCFKYATSVYDTNVLNVFKSLNPNTIYTISATVNYISAATGRITLVFSDGSTSILFVVNKSGYSYRNFSLTQEQIDNISSLIFYGEQESNGGPIIWDNIQLELGDTATDYKPYFDGLKSVEYTGLEVKGKNLFDISKVVQSNSIKSDNKDITCSSYGSSIGLLKDLCPSLKVGDAVTLSLKVKSTTSVAPNFVQIQGQILNFAVQTPTFTVTEAGLNSNFYLYNTTFENMGVPTTSVYTDIMIELGDTATDYKPYREPVNILPLTTTLRGVDTYKDRIIITKNESNDYYTATKETNCEVVDYTSGDEDNVEYITDLTTTVKPLETPTTEVLSTTLTESDVMPLLELGGSIEIINENSLYVTGSTALEMVYKLINNAATSEVTE